MERERIFKSHCFKTNKEKLRKGNAENCNGKKKNTNPCADIDFQILCLETCSVFPSCSTEVKNPCIIQKHGKTKNLSVYYITFTFELS